MTGNVMLSEVRARIAEYREPLLLIDGRGVGMAADMLQFVDDSPLQGTVSRHTRDLHVTGEAKLGLSLWLPLAQLSATKVQGSVDLSGNEVRVDHTLPPFKVSCWADRFGWTARRTHRDGCVCPRRARSMRRACAG
jgi:uncharacterized protein YhdP